MTVLPASKSRFCAAFDFREDNLRKRLKAVSTSRVTNTINQRKPSSAISDSGLVIAQIAHYVPFRVKIKMRCAVSTIRHAK